MSFSKARHFIQTVIFWCLNAKLLHSIIHICQKQEFGDFSSAIFCLLLGEITFIFFEIFKFSISFLNYELFEWNGEDLNIQESSRKFKNYSRKLCLCFASILFECFFYYLLPVFHSFRLVFIGKIFIKEIIWSQYSQKLWL